MRPRHVGIEAHGFEGIFLGKGIVTRNLQGRELTIYESPDDPEPNGEFYALLTDSTNPGIVALIESAGLTGRRVSDYDVGFKLAPRIAKKLPYPAG